MKRIAITGASGFVGRSLVSRLKKDGHEVVAISRFPQIDHCEINFSVCLDYRNTLLLAKFFEAADAVIHLAGHAHHLSCVDVGDLGCYQAANVDSLVSVARASRNAGVKRVVFVSSIGVNGSSTNSVPFTESDLPAPAEPYALSKLMAEQALAAELEDCVTDWVVLRPPLVYGPGCPGNMRRLIRLASSAPLLPFGALHAGRTLISIENLLDALLIAADHPAVSRNIFVISDSQDIDVAGIIEALFQGLGRGLWRLLPVPVALMGFVFYLLGKKMLWQKFSSELLIDSSAFCRATGWSPVVSPRDGLRSTAAAALVA